MSGKKHQHKIDFPFQAPQELEAYLPYLLTRLANRWAANQDEALQQDGLQGSKMRILSCLSAFDELTINELSVLSVTDQSSASRTVEALVQSGLTERNISEKDQRVRTVKLTPNGFKTLDEITPRVIELNQGLLEDVDPDELAICVKVLRRMLKNIKRNKI